MSDITNAIQDLTRNVQKAINSQSATDVSAAHESANKYRLYATAVSAAGIALFVLGLAMCATGIGAAIGILMIVVSLPTLYFGVNGYNTLTNIKNIIDNPRKYLAQQEGRPPQVNTALLKQDLKANTLGFDWVIDPRIESAAAAAA